MPVVEKIEALGFSVKIYNGACEIIPARPGEKYRYHYSQVRNDEDKKLGTHEGVFQFIEWYNTQPK